MKIRIDNVKAASFALILSVLATAFFLFLCYGAAVLGSLWTSSSVGTWYADLRKPSVNPPNWIFAPVWSTLYFLMALSAWQVWRKAGWSGARFALALFFGQLG